MAPAETIPAERTEQIQNIAIGRLLNNSANPRKKLRELEDLTASVKAKGVLVPLTVELVGGNYRLIAGHRRLAAAQKAGKTTVPCIVRRYTDDDRFEAMLVDNIQRNDLDPIEEAEAYDQLYNRGLSQQQIADRVGKSVSTVCIRMQLLDLPASDRKKISEGKLSQVEALGYLRRVSQPGTRPGDRCRSCGQKLPELKANYQPRKRLPKRKLAVVS